MPSPLDDLLDTVRTLTHQSSETVEPWHSYWHHRPTRDFPPKAIRDPEDYSGGERLCLTITQTDLPAKAQKALVKRWCDLLPTLTNVKTLWFQSRTSQEMFEAACAVPNLEGLYIKWGALTDMTPITQAQGLKALHIGGSPSMQHLEALTGLPNLQWLELENIKALADPAFVGQLTRLRGLSLAGGDIGTGNVVKMDSLSALAGLQDLEWLALSYLRVADESLAPLAALPKLKVLLISNQFPAREYAWLAGRRPDIQCEKFTPVDGPVNWTQCKKCKQKMMVFLTGKEWPMLCAACDQGKIDRFRTDFAGWVAEGRVQ